MVLQLLYQVKCLHIFVEFMGRLHIYLEPAVTLKIKCTWLEKGGSRFCQPDEDVVELYRLDKEGILFFEKKL